MNHGRGPPEVVKQTRVCRHTQQSSNPDSGHVWHTESFPYRKNPKFVSMPNIAKCQRCCLVFLVMVVIVLVITIQVLLGSNYYYIKEFRVNFLYTETFTDYEELVSNHTKTILLWTLWFGDKHWWRQSGFGRSPFERCSYKDCFATRDKSFISKADLVLFHCMNPVFRLPQYGKQNQIYAFDCMESPSNSGITRLQKKVNLTISYRKDSDIFKPYFEIRKRPKPISEPYKPRIPLKEKTHSVVWLVSHCHTTSKRERYVAQLAQYIDVDIIGSCGQEKCGKSEGCLGKFEKKYKFYISFENSVCRDYISEKSADPLEYELVPIVFGGGDYKTDLPPNSYIDIKDFNSPKLLANYLQRLMVNETEYNKYFQWKQSYTVHQWETNIFCEMCKILHEGKFKREASQFDVRAWWEKDVCSDDEIYKYIPR